MLDLLIIELGMLHLCIYNYFDYADLAEVGELKLLCGIYKGRCFALTSTWNAKRGDFCSGNIVFMVNIQFVIHLQWKADPCMIACESIQLSCDRVDLVQSGRIPDRRGSGHVSAEAPRLLDGWPGVNHQPGGYGQSAETGEVFTVLFF